MSATFVGQLAFAAGSDKSTGQIVDPLCPLVVKSAGGPAIAIAAAIDGLLALQAQITITPPNLTLILDALVEFQAQCAIGLSFSLPTVSFDVTASAQLVADLSLALTLLIALEALLALPVTVAWQSFPYPTPGTLLTTAMVQPPLVDHAILLIAADLPTPLSSGAAKAALEAFCGGVDFSSPNAGVFSTLGDLTPVTLNALAQARASIEYQLGLALQLDAFVKINPPTFTASIDATLKFAAHLRAAIDLALPHVSFELKAIARIVADLQARFGILYLLGIALNPAGALFVWRWHDTGTSFSTELNIAFGGNFDGPTGYVPLALPCEAAVFWTGDAVSWTALVDSASGALFGGAA